MKISSELFKNISFGLAVILFVAGCNNPQSNINLSDKDTLNTESIKVGSNEFDAQGYSKSSVIVKLKSTVDKVSSELFANKYNSKVQRIISRINVIVLQVPSGKTIQQFVKTLSEDSMAVYAEPDMKVDLDDYTVNDPLFNSQYALKKVEALKAWAVNSGKDTVKIGIVDTGVDPDHPELKDKLLPGYNAITPGQFPKDDARHGTHVSGISAAISNNGIGVAGLAVKCRIIPVKVLGNGTGSLSTIADGLIWAADHGADVVNMSLGTYDENQTLGEAVKYALGKNVVCIATMGNDNTEKKRYPAAFPGMIAVGSTDENDKKSSFSNYGPWMTVSAPGSNILSTLPTYMSSNGYGNLSGTSMAAPLVTGLAALIRSQSEGLPPKDVAKVLQNSADDLGETGYDKYFGAGRINAFKAVNLAKDLK